MIPWSPLVVRAETLGLSLSQPPGIVVTPVGTPSADLAPLSVQEAKHPNLSLLTESHRFIALLCGGSSALVEVLLSTLTLEDLQDLTVLLLRSNLPIQTVNTIRKHISAIKGGRLAYAKRAFDYVRAASNIDMLRHAQVYAREQDIPCHVLTPFLQGEAREVVSVLMALAALQQIRDRAGILLLCAASDGVAGNSPAAGALVDRSVHISSVSQNLAIERFLSENDTYSFFAQTGGLLQGGLTGTNVMDLIVKIVDAPEQ